MHPELRSESVDHPRQSLEERRPLAEPTVNGDLTAQLLRQSTRDAESKTRSAIRARPRLIELAEIFPDQVDLFGFDSDARVDHLEHDRGARAPARDSNR